MNNILGLVVYKVRILFAKSFLAGLVSVIFLQFSFSQQASPGIRLYSDEEVDYSLRYGFFKIGEAHVEFNNSLKCNGAFIQAYARSTGLVKFIKDIFYKYECCMDVASGLPFTDSRILIEGDYIDTGTVYYDRLSRKDSTVIYSKKTGTITGPKGIYDLLSAFYYYRSNFLGNNLPLNQRITITTFFIDKVWDLIITYHGKETISTKLGPVECLKVKPVTVIGHFFRTSDAMTIWFTNDGRYIPVKFTLEFKLGTLNGIITEYNK